MHGPPDHGRTEAVSVQDLATERRVRRWLDAKMETLLEWWVPEAQNPLGQCTSRVFAWGLRGDDGQHRGGATGGGGGGAR
nr:unnamed protein product [Digitaria exilis]CAB3503241.1 unnamed protein product [Digitaria exilis]